MLDNMPRGTICIEDIEIGMTRSLRKTITDHDIELFGEISTDRNPVHFDDDYANDTIFEGRIAHGMLTAGLISAVIGEQLPGHGTIYMGQTLKFLAPVRPGDTVLAEVTVTDIIHAKRRVALECRCTVGDTVVLKGEAMVLAPSRTGPTFLTRPKAVLPPLAILMVCTLVTAVSLTLRANMAHLVLSPLNPIRVNILPPAPRPFA